MTKTTNLLKKKKKNEKIQNIIKTTIIISQ